MGTTGVELSGLSEVMRALADLTRLRLLMELSAGERNVTALVNRTGYDQPAVSHHLGILRHNRLVLARRSGKEVFYRLAQESPAAGTIQLSAAGGTTVRIEPLSAAPPAP